MLSASLEFRRRIAESSRTLFRADLVLADGTELSLGGDDVMMGSLSFTESVSGTSSFDVGNVIGGSLSLDLNNYDERFDAYDFTGAEIVPYIGVELSGGSVEWLRKGRWTVRQPSTYGNRIALECDDCVAAFAAMPYDEVRTAYPARLDRIVADICAACGVGLATPTFGGSEYLAAARPEDGRSCLQVLCWAVQAAGCFGHVAQDGRLAVQWYETGAFEGEDWLDGGTYETASVPYSDGDAADGGDFIDYGSGYGADGGGFSAGKYANIYSISQMTVGTDDVVITGVRVTASDEAGDGGSEGETALCGSEGYVIEVSGNPLIGYGTAQAVADAIGAKAVGMAFRPFKVSAIGSPCWEAGDPVLITDARQRTYRSYATSLTWKAGAYESVSCGARAAGRGTASMASSLTEAVVEARKAVKREAAARERAISDLSRAVAETGGVYQTEERQPDGSVVYMLHDKPTPGQSRVIWRMGADAIGVSTDGGETYSAGMTVEGDAVLRRIYAVGIDATYINTGELSVEDGGEVLFRARFGDPAQGIPASVIMNAGNVYMGSVTIKSAVENVTDLANSSARFGTCATAAATAAKTVSLSDFKLRAGATVSVRFANANSAANPTLNVNGTGARAVQINGSNIARADWWAAGDVRTFVYDGTAWQVSDGAVATTVSALRSQVAEIAQTQESITLSVASLQALYGTCSTAAATAAKAVTCEGFRLYKGAMVCVYFTYANTAASPTLNVNGTGAKAIRTGSGAMQPAEYWSAGTMVTFVYSGSYWQAASGALYKSVASLTSSVSSLSVRSDSIEASVAGVKARYGSCPTAAGTKVKAVSVTGFAAEAGATVCVSFANANTAATPELKVTGSSTAQGTIRLNGKALPEASYWKAGDVLTLVWDGTYWNIGDGWASSQITALRDSISLSVSNLALGSKAEITLSVGGTSQKATADLTKVRQAFANDASAITISAGTVAFTANTFTVDSDNFKVTKNGTITANAGVIGGFTINSSYLYGDHMTMDHYGLNFYTNQSTRALAAYLGGRSRGTAYTGVAGRLRLVLGAQEGRAFAIETGVVTPSGSIGDQSVLSIHGNGKYGQAKIYFAGSMAPLYQATFSLPTLNFIDGPALPAGAESTLASYMKPIVVTGAGGAYHTIYIHHGLVCAYV